MSDVADEVLGPKATDQSMAGKVMMGASLLGTGYGAMMSPLGTSAALGLGHTLAGRGTQRMLTGDTALQQGARSLYNQLNNSQYMDPEALASALRRGTVNETSKDLYGY